ncbi:MAG: carboxypeptidase-like regulatory domain-containing protein [Planctomycetota bacterium]|nr:carboxypeptidase-like regulatory domain-containing protein [Planctomycetota bacterium]
MGTKWISILAISAAVIGLFFLLGGPALLSELGDGATDGSGAHSGDLRGLDGSEAGADARDAEGKGGPILFGRAREQRKGLGSLQGRVVDFSTGEPAAGARLTLVGTGYAEETVAAQATADASGYFHFADVPAGDGYLLRISDDRNRQRTVPSRSVDHGEVADIGTVWLGRHGLLAGRVIDGAGQPVPGAVVQAHAGGGSMLEMLSNMVRMFEQLDKDAQPIAEVVTDARGLFKLPDMAPGPLTLVVRAVGFRQVTRGIVMAEEGAAGGDIEVRLESTEVITGIVVSGEGRPIAGARLACLEQADMESVMFGRQFTETGADGRFTINSPPSAGELAVIVTARGYPTLFTKTTPTPEQRFVLTGGTEVVLRVVKADTKAAVEGAQLMAMFTGGDGWEDKSGMTYAAVVTDARGEGTCIARQGSLQMMFFHHPEFGTAVFSPQLAVAGLAGARSLLQGPADTTIGTARTTFEFTLGTGITVEGRVTDEAGQPLAGVRCLSLGSMGMGGSTETDADGRYALRNLSAPITAILASKPGYIQPDDALMASMGVPKTGDSVVDLVLSRAASVTGRVLTKEGRPLAGVRVKATSEGGMGSLTAMLGGAAETMTNADGAYVLDGVRPSKEARVMARHAGYLDARSAPFAVAAATASVAPPVILVTGSAIDVRVERPDGRAATGATVTVDVEPLEPVEWDPMGGFRSFASLRTDGRGVTKVSDVPVGSVTLTARLEGDAPGRVVLQIPADERPERLEAVLRLRVGVVLTCLVQDPDGKPLADANVQVAAADPEDTSPEAWVPGSFESADKDGRVEVRGLPGVPLRLQISSQGFRAASQVVTPGLGPVTVRLERQDAGAAARLAEIQAELMGIYQSIGQAKDAEERTALAKRMQALNKEKVDLGGE